MSAAMAFSESAAAEAGGKYYGKAVVNAGESFVYTSDDGWEDWKPTRDQVSQGSNGCEIDNFAIKAYVVPADGTGEKTSAIAVPDKTVTYNGKVVKSSKAAVAGSKGNVTYKYFNSNKEAIEASSVKNAGTYYVKAYLEAKDGYEAAESDYAKIVILC